MGEINDFSPTKKWELGAYTELGQFPAIKVGLL
jgi:hypothetical protein